jgi:endoglucanase
VAVANTQEEIAEIGGGAMIAASTINPTVALVIDLMSAIDQPIPLEIDHRPECSLDDGPFLTRGGAASPVVFDRLEVCAKKLGINYGLLAIGGSSSSDMEAVALARTGIPTSLVSLPSRYLHSPSETISLEDWKNTIRLVTAFCQTVKPGMDWSVR